MTVYIVGLILCCYFLGVPYYSEYIYICIHIMFIVTAIYENFMYSSLHVNEEFVIVAKCDGLSGVSVAWQR